MRVTPIVSAVALATCLAVPAATPVVAGDAPKKPSAVRRFPLPTPPDTDAYYGGTKVDTITEYQNDLGQTVYSIAASHFDVSRPLIEMASEAAPEPLDVEEVEPPSSPRVPAWRIIGSGVDPVVQPVVKASDISASSSITPSAPTMGFNFLGVGMGDPFAPGSPSDSNGSVGNNQFVETVNVRFQVWSLNRATQTATSILAPSRINTLWSGFGGACEEQNSGDPIVLYDKLANRWIISQFTAGSSSTYFECVAVSTTANATGTYARYAFAIPHGKFGDYPHLAVWNDAYYMMAHGKGGVFVAIFAAMDRTKMLMANPAATWIVIQDPMEGGHMPADLDGFALPPTSALARIDPPLLA